MKEVIGNLRKLLEDAVEARKKDAELINKFEDQITDLQDEKQQLEKKVEELEESIYRKTMGKFAE